jgi:fatty-acyl-CoA synthase
MYLGDWTGALARLFGEREALFDSSRDIRWSYAQLASRTDRAAAALAAAGVERGDRVCVLAKNRLEQIELLFACARLGALFVPLNWRLKEPELAFLLDDAEPRLLFFDGDFDYVTGRLCATRDIDPVRFDTAEDDDGEPDQRSWPELLAESAEQPTPAQVALTIDDPWIVLYTSGTTGHPKGALLPFRQVAFNALNTITALDLSSTDSTVTYTPLFHTGALHVLTTPLLAKGGRIILTEGFDTEQVLDLIDAGDVTLLFGVPTTLEMLAASPRFDDVDFGRVRLALCGGAPCPVSLIERYTSRDVVFKQGYGLTEVGPNCLNLNPQDVVRKKGSAGQPNLTVAARVLDDEGRVVEGEGRGELCLGGPCVCLGYWRRADATAAAFTDDGFFRTGDIVEVDAEGYYFIVDRKKDMFISGGENVYPAEVERTLSDHPEVRACAVVGVPDERWGEVGRAYLELRVDDHGIDESTLAAWAKDRLASYKVPKEFVVMPELPRNASGKVQKHLLAGGAA